MNRSYTPRFSACWGCRATKASQGTRQPTVSFTGFLFDPFLCLVDVRIAGGRPFPLSSRCWCFCPFTAFHCIHNQGEGTSTSRSRSSRLLEYQFHIYHDCQQARTAPQARHPILFAVSEPHVTKALICLLKATYKHIGAHTEKQEIKDFFSFFLPMFCRLAVRLVVKRNPDDIFDLRRKIRLSLWLLPTSLNSFVASLTKSSTFSVSHSASASVYIPSL